MSVAHAHAVTKHTIVTHYSLLQATIRIMMQPLMTSERLAVGNRQHKVSSCKALETTIPSFLSVPKRPSSMHRETVSAYKALVNSWRVVLLVRKGIAYEALQGSV